MQHTAEVTAEEDEAFEELARKLKLTGAEGARGVGDAFVDYGRKLEYLGHMLQQSDSTIKDLVAAARDVNFNLKFSIQREVGHE